MLRSIVVIATARYRGRLLDGFFYNADEDSISKVKQDAAKMAFWLRCAQRKAVTC